MLQEGSVDAARTLSVDVGSHPDRTFLPPASWEDQNETSGGFKFTSI